MAPAISAAQFSITENSASGTVVGTVSATDPGPDTLTYSIVGGTGVTAFAVNSETGEITVADASQLDYETTPVFSLQILVEDGDGGTAMADVTIDLINQASISGVVFVDSNANGQFDADEIGVDGVTIDLLNAAGDLLFSTVTADGGLYLFEDLQPGDYIIRETQPANLADGFEYPGSAGGTVVANDAVQVAVGTIDAVDYGFSEFAPAVTRNDTAPASFWQSGRGQNLIRAGGEQLANWLSTTFSNVFGDVLVGATGDDVASFYKNELYRQKGKKTDGPARVDASFMAVALNVYFTSSSLAGDVATGYGFTVTQTGIGASRVNIGSSGAAFEAADDSDLTIVQILSAVNRRTDTLNSQPGWASIYDTNGDGIIDAQEALQRTLASNVLDSILSAR
ncbi:MAG: SdrD B-like domain-containing protein [Planctomycetaceae bacterium]